MRLLIAGAGDLGSRLATLAVAAGHQASTVRRSLQAVPGCELLQGDLQQPDLWLPARPEFDALVWCATPDQRDRDGYAAIYQHALRATLELWASRAVLPRVLLTSSTAVYAENGLRHDEHSSDLASSWNGLALLAAEQALRAYAPDVLIARLGGIYGPGRSWLLRRVRAGSPVQEQPPRWTNRIHVQDAAAAVLFLLQQPAAPAICNVVDPHCSPEHEVLDWLAAQLHLPALPRHRPTNPELGKQVIPVELLRLGFGWSYPDFRSGYASMLED